MEDNTLTNWDKLKCELMSEINIRVIEKLFLDKHRIAFINENAFHGFVALKELHLSRNQLSKLNERVFRDLSFLVSLDLSLNQLTRIGEKTFEGLKNLVKLDLSGNQIQILSEKTFQGLSCLEELYLSRNKLKFINDGTFKGLVNLKILYLFDNEINGFSENVFADLLNLNELDMSFNNLNDISENSFRNLNNLSRLYLFLNKLTAIRDKTFQNLTNLKLLYLSRNKIGFINDIIFRNLSNLEILDISLNYIKSIETTTFKNLTNLNELYLFGNKIETLNSNVFSSLNKLTELCVFDQTVFYSPSITIENYEINKYNINLIIGKTFRNNFICSEYAIKNNHLNSIKLTNKKWRNFQANFEWSSISAKLSALTGSSGTGKTNILKLINNSINKTNKQYYDTTKFFVCKYFNSESFYNNAFIESDFDKFEENTKTFKNLSIKKEFVDYLYDSINYFSLIQYFDYLIIFGVELKEINGYLNSKKFKYKFGEKRFKERKTQQQHFLNDLCYRTESYYKSKLKPSIEYYLDMNEDINNGNAEIKLSSGEHFTLLIYLWSFHAQKILEQEREQPIIKSKLRIILLDQPDTFMDTNLIKEFISLILSNKLDYLNFQIIMTTSNLLTLSLVPYAKISVLTFCDKTGLHRTHNIESKQQAISLLTNNFHLSNVPTKIVFVENNLNLKYFTMMDSYLTKRGFFMSTNEHSLTFFSIDQKAHSNTSNANGKNSSSYKVEKLVRNFIDIDKMSANQIFGFVETKIKNLKKIKNVVSLSRHGIANYIYDPIQVFIYLLIKCRNELEILDSQIKELSIKDVFDITQLSFVNLKHFLQMIVDYFAQLFIKELNDESIDQMKYLNERVDVKFTYCLEKKFIEIYDNVNQEDEEYFFISYPRFFIDMKGNDLKDMYIKIFPKIPSDINTLVNFIGNEILENTNTSNDKFLNSANFFRLIPCDLLENFRTIKTASRVGVDDIKSESNYEAIHFNNYIYDSTTLSQAVDFLCEKSKTLQDSNLSELLCSLKSKSEIILQVVYKINNSKFKSNNNALNKSLLIIVNQQISDSEKHEKISLKLEEYLSEQEEAKLRKKEQILDVIKSPIEAYNYFYELNRILNKRSKLKRIHESLDESSLIARTKEAIDELIKLTEYIDISRVKQSYIENLYSVVRNEKMTLADKIKEITSLVDIKYYAQHELNNFSNENLMINILNVFIYLKEKNGNISTNAKLSNKLTFLDDLILEIQDLIDSYDNDYEYILKQIITRFCFKLEDFILNFMVKVVSPRQNASIKEYFDESSGKLKTKSLKFKTNQENSEHVNLDYPLILFKCSLEDLIFIYKTIFQVKLMPSFEDLIQFVNDKENDQNYYKNSSEAFQSLIFPLHLLNRYNYIENQSSLLELLKTVKLNYKFRLEQDIFLNMELKRFIYNPINIFFYFYHKNSNDKLMMKDFYKSVENKIMTDSNLTNENQLTIKMKIYIREISLNYVLKKFVRQEIIEKLQTKLNDVKASGGTADVEFAILIKKMVSLEIINTDYLITDDISPVTMKIILDYTKNHILQLKFDYPSMFVKLMPEDLKKIYENISPVSYSFESEDLVRFLKDENNLNELILIHNLVENEPITTRKKFCQDCFFMELIQSSSKFITYDSK